VCSSDLWTGPTDYPLSGDEASEQFMSALGQSVRPVRQERTEAYRLDCLAFCAQRGE
jgi:hypothetical protein